MANHNRLGEKGETLAVDFLKAKGYHIVERNKRFGRAEIDIIAKIGEEIVFVEVKTRTSDYFGFPEESIDSKKIELMGKAAEQFEIDTDEKFTIRFDCISVVIGVHDTEIIHIEDAFLPGMHEF